MNSEPSVLYGPVISRAPMKFLKRRVFRQFVRMRRFVVHNILHADDPPHRLALGLAIGWFWTFTPFIGIQMVAVIATAWLLRANKLVGLPLVWISNPATFVPIFYPCYLIGLKVLGWPSVGQEWWSQLGSPPESGFWAVTEFYWTRVMEIFTPLMLGCFVIGVPGGGILYVGSRVAIEKYRAAMHRRGMSITAKIATAAAIPRKNG
jgi:uncharacterized protein (DUF2062 family)